MARVQSMGRPALARFQVILSMLKEGGYPNANTMAQRIEVSAKTVRRDLDTMRDRLGVDIEYVASQHGYVLGDNHSDLPLFDLEVGDLAALYLASQSLKGNSRLNDVLQHSFQKLAGQFEGKLRLNWQEFDEMFAVRPSGEVPVDPALFEKMSRAVLECYQVRFGYRKPECLKSEQRVVEPYFVGELKGGFYMVGYDREREGMRTFAMQRIIGLQYAGAGFVRDPDFSIDRYFGGAVGAFTPVAGAEEEEAVIECRGWLARVVQERQWHPSQSTRVLDDYGQVVELRMRLRDWREMLSLVLSWGRVAKVIEPPRLVEMVKAELEAMRRV